MNNKYKDNPCPVCGKPFADGDDIVVCPECGTPHHRTCWAKAGACANAAKHGPDFEWQPKTPEAAAEEPVCPNCGTHNPPQAKFCIHCGVPIGQGATPPPRYAPGGNAARGASPYDIGAMPGFGSEIGPDDMLDGIKARDWASYVGNSGLYYLMQFTRLSVTGRKTCVSFSAFLLGPFYFLYRKMWKQGVAFALVDLLLSVPTALYLLKLSGAPLVAGIPAGWIAALLNACYLINWLQMVLRSLFAVYWYKKECTRRIRAIYDRLPEGDARTSELAMRGGISIWAVLLYAGLMTLLGLGLFTMMGPNTDVVLSALM